MLPTQLTKLPSSKQTLKWVGIWTLIIFFIFATATFFLWIRYPSLANYKHLFPSDKLPATTSLTVRYWGVSTLVLSDGETTIMTDGFFTRPSLFKSLFGKLQPDLQKISEALKKLQVKNLAVIIPLHSHHDHAMDAPEVARKTGAQFLGSESSANIARGWGLDNNKISIAAPNQPYHFGAFTLYLIPSNHAPIADGLSKRLGLGEKITEPVSFPAKLSAFKEGITYSLVVEHPLGNVLIHASAGMPDQALSTYRTDVVFLGIGNLGKQGAEFQKNYFRKTVYAVGAKKVIPIHWDDFTLPVGDSLTPFNSLVGDFDGTMQVISRMTNESGAELVMLNSGREYRLFETKKPE